MSEAKFQPDHALFPFLQLMQWGVKCGGFVAFWWGGAGIVLGAVFGACVFPFTDGCGLFEVIGGGALGGMIGGGSVGMVAGYLIGCQQALALARWKMMGAIVQEIFSRKRRLEVIWNGEVVGNVKGGVFGAGSLHAVWKATDTASSRHFLWALGTQRDCEKLEVRVGVAEQWAGWIRDVPTREIRIEIPRF